MEAIRFFEYVRKLSHLHENSQQHFELSFLRKQESRVFLFTDEEKSKNPGSSIKNVEDDREWSEASHFHLLACRPQACLRNHQEKSRQLLGRISIEQAELQFFGFGEGYGVIVR